MDWRKYFAAFVCVLLFGLSNPSISVAQLSTVGREFWFGFMENNRVQGTNPFNSAPDVGIIIITAEENTTGVIQYQANSITFSLNAGQQFIYRIEDFDIIHRTSGIVESKWVYITSSGNISVHAFNERIRSADGTVILPLTALGKDYLVTSHYEFMDLPLNYNPNVNDESILLVLATENNTRIEITPSVFTLNGNAPNVPFTITLNRGQTYQLKALGDLTGSRVRVVGDTANDCKNIAVFGGNKWTSVGQCGAANDHLFQQIYPTSTWGTDYIHIPLGGRTSGELVKVLASEDGTDVSINGTIVSTLNAGQYRTLEFSATEVASIVTSKPSAVTVFAKSQECNDPAQFNFDKGDPFMITYSPNNQRLTSLTFNALQLPSIDQHFITVIVPTTSIGATRYDGGPVVTNLFQQVPGTEFSYIRLQISEGVHRLENPDGFIAYVYGFGFIESYGYSAGARLENLNFEVEPLYDFEVEGNRVACLNNEALWEIFPENELFTYFLWDFGDGSNQKEGKAINHTYSEEGVFEISVIAALSPDSCDEQQTITFEVRVESTTGTLEGPQSVCPEVEELIYRFNGTADLLKTEFMVEGGTITDVDESAGTVTIQWGEANPAARIVALPYNLQGCPGDEVELIVVINQVIESSIPQGDAQICFDLNRTNTYTIQNPTPNRIFTWFITGGEFVGGNDGNSVEVLWTAAGTMGKIWYTEVSTIDELCEGESPKLNVSINPLLEAQIQSINMVSCFGGTDGSIVVSSTGGTAPYTYQWSHDPSLNQPKADGLIAGSYQIKILDSKGCDVELLDVEIIEPDLLEIISLSTEPTSCFGKDDGRASISIQGGTMPYSIDFPGSQFQGKDLLLTGLEGRSYSLEVSDANGCTIPVFFEVTSPIPLEVDVRVLRPACPGESNGQLLAEPTGEFRPFIFTWDFDNSGEVILSDIPRGTYTVSVRNQSGCISVGKADMIEARPQVRMPTGFKLEEGEFKAVSNCTLNFDIKIINRWGQLVYMGSEGWNGLIDGEPAPLGSYSYVFSYQYTFEGSIVQEEIRGVVTLIR